MGTFACSSYGDYAGPEHAARAFCEAVLAGDRSGVEEATHTPLSESDVAELRANMFGEKQSVAGATVGLDDPQPSAEDPDNWSVLVSTYRVDGEERIVDASGSPVLVYVDRISGQWRVVAVEAHGLVAF